MSTASRRCRHRRAALRRSERTPRGDDADDGPRGRLPARSGRARKRAILLATLLGFLLVAPAGAANADPLWWQALTNPNSICSPSDPVPEVAGSGLSGLIDPPGRQSPVTPYNNYEMAGLTWHATDLGCSDYLAIVGNYAANFVFMIAKAIDRVTITAYQTAYSPGLLQDLSNAVAGLVRSLGETFYLPYVTPVVLIGVMWLAWHGLVRRRATTSVEGVVWMIIAVTLALWFLNRPQDIMRAGNTVVTGANCAITKGVARIDPNTSGQCFASEGNGPSAVAQTADSLWTVLIYRPWLAGEFGQGAAAGNPRGASTALAQKYGGTGERSLLWTQALTHKDLQRIRVDGQYESGVASGVINDKHARWEAIRQDIKNNYPSSYPLFQGRQWGTRLGIAFAAFIAAIFAGGLILLVSVALIVLKLGFLLLMMTGPFFLLVGIHPGVGRVIALRWGELLVSTLLKQVVVALALAVLLFGYSVITAGSNLSWGLQVLLLSLLGIAAFVYRKPFQHLFASVSGTGFGARVVGESAGTNAELQSAHRRLAKAPAGPPVVRRIGGRLAGTAIGGAVAGAVGGKAAAAGVGASGNTEQPDSATAGQHTPAAGSDESAAAETEREESRQVKNRRLAGLRTGPRTGAPPPLDLSPRRPDERAPGNTQAPDGESPRSATPGQQAPSSDDHPRPAPGPPKGARPVRSPWPGSAGHRPAAEPPSEQGASGAPTRGAGGGSNGTAPGAHSRARGRGEPAGPVRERDESDDGEKPPRTPSRRRSESAPPLPFWLRPNNRGGDGR